MMAALVAASTCAPCHQREAASQVTTSMARAMQPVAACVILEQHPALTFREGIYYYRIERKENQSIYSVTDGKDTITVPLEYAFGLGQAGQTYVFERNRHLYESRVSFYQALNGLDLTIGATNLKPQNLDEAAGRLMSRQETGDCFGCHTTSEQRNESPTPESVTPGVTCEHCHGSAAAHVAGFRQGRPVTMPKLSAMTTEELSDFCGQCHRTWAQIATSGPRNINNVRFQPFRLANSKCYDPSDNRIKCTACHNVHEEVVAQASAYDSKCLACHTTGKNCPVAVKDCTTCHMPKLELPGSHYQFADHRIRIVKAGAPYPP